MNKALSFGPTAIFFFTSLPALHFMQQESTDPRAEVHHLLTEANDLVTEIESAGDRAGVFKQIGAASWKAGDKETAAESYNKALKDIATIRQENPDQDIREFDRAMIAIDRARADDLDGALQTLSLIKSEEDRSYVLPDIASAQARAENCADAVHTASSIQEPDHRDEALTWIASQQAKAGDTQGAEQLVRSIKNAKYGAHALAHIATLNAAGGHTAEVHNAIQEALGAAEQPEPLESGDGRSGLAACMSEEPEQPRDRALERIASNQVRTGDVEGALETINRMHDEAGKENMLATAANYQARAGDFIGARASIRSIGREGCKTAALNGIVIAQFEAGNLSAALVTVDEMTEMYQKALTLAYLAERVAEQGAGNSAVGILARAHESARQIPDDHNRVSMLEQIARNQAKAGSREEAAMTLAEALPLAIASQERAKRNNGSNSSLQNFAAAQGAIGDLNGAWNTLALVDEGARVTLVQNVAWVRSNEGDMQGALAWAARQASPRDKALAFIGAAEGVLECLESEAN
jgi:hypothetical protein